MLPNGDITQFGGKVVKNSSGYDLKDLMIGSEGTLGFITKAILKLLPLPKKVISLLIPFPTLKRAIDSAFDYQVKIYPDRHRIYAERSHRGCGEIFRQGISG